MHASKEYSKIERVRGVQLVISGNRGIHCTSLYLFPSNDINKLLSSNKVLNTIFIDSYTCVDFFSFVYKVNL